MSSGPGLLACFALVLCLLVALRITRDHSVLASALWVAVAVAARTLMLEPEQGSTIGHRALLLVRSALLRIHDC